MEIPTMTTVVRAFKKKQILPYNYNLINIENRKCYFSMI